MEQEKNIESIEKELPPPAFEAGRTETYWVTMCDGVKLHTIVFFPKGKGPWPVIFIRTPYGIPIEYGKIFPKYGYAVVIQEVRGRGNSEGIWVPFQYERQDGLDSLDWLVKQKWMNGNIGLFGASYVAAVQWFVADRLPPEVKTMVIQVFGTDSYGTFYKDGMFREMIWTLWTFWAIANSGASSETEGRKRYEEALRIRPAINRDMHLFGKPLPWYRDWIVNASPASPYWNTGIWGLLRTIPSKIEIPLFLVGGWYDHFLEQMLAAYDQLPQPIKDSSRFVIGPWAHDLELHSDLMLPNSQMLGTLTIKASLEWFDYRLKGAPYPHPLGGIEAYTIKPGNGKWKYWPSGIQSSACRIYYLKPSYDFSFKGGRLVNEWDGAQDRITFQYDPNHPVRSKGGAYDVPPDPGIVLQDEPGLREDILTFQSEPLQHDMPIAGRMKVRLNVSSSARDTSFTVKISEVLHDGRAYNIRDGITSLAYRNGRAVPDLYEPGKIVGIEIELWTITWTINKGSRIRLDISSSNFPFYHAHPNLPGLWAYQTTTVIADQTLHWGRHHPSYLQIPVE